MCIVLQVKDAQGGYSIKRMILKHLWYDLVLVIPSRIIPHLIMSVQPCLSNEHERELNSPHKMTF